MPDIAPLYTLLVTKIDQFHNLPPILPILQKGRTTLEWTGWRHRNVNNNGLSPQSCKLGPCAAPMSLIVQQLSECSTQVSRPELVQVAFFSSHSCGYERTTMCTIQLNYHVHHSIENAYGHISKVFHKRLPLPIIFQAVSRCILVSIKAETSWNIGEELKLLDRKFRSSKTSVGIFANCGGEEVASGIGHNSGYVLWSMWKCQRKIWFINSAANSKHCQPDSSL